MKALSVLAVSALLVSAALAPLAVASPTPATATAPLVTQTPDAHTNDTIDTQRRGTAMEPIVTQRRGTAMEPIVTQRRGTAIEPQRGDAATIERQRRSRVAGNNTTARVTVVGPTASNFSTISLDFGATMASDTHQVASKYHISLVSYQLERAQSPTVANAVVNDYLDAAVTELDDLQEAERRAVTRYRTGETGVETLLVELSMIDRRSRAIDEALARIRFTNSDLSRTTLNRIENVRLAVTSFQTPIRDHVALAVTGELEGDSNPLFVTAGENAVVVEMLDAGIYHRNAVRFDDRATGTVDQLGSLQAFQNRIEDRYPWSYRNRQDIAIDAFTDRNLYTATYRHPQGRMKTYVDGGTTNVYREHQSLILDRLPGTDRHQTSVNNVSVVIDGTAADGPFQVNVTQAATGAPIDAVVRVDGVNVGSTGSDGTLWAVAPPRPYHVTVVAESAWINVTVS